MKLTAILILFFILVSCSKETDSPETNIAKEVPAIENNENMNETDLDTVDAQFQIMPKTKENEAEQTDNSIWRKYTLRSGVIEYEFEGMDGFENLFWDRYGALEARYHISKRQTLEGTKESEMLIIYNDSMFYSINLKERKGIVRNMNDHLEIKSAMRNYSTELLKEMNAEKIGTGKVLKRDCEKWKLQDGVVMWLSEGMPLKIEFGTVSVRAKAFFENVNISKDKFIVPDGITLSRE